MMLLEKNQNLHWENKNKRTIYQIPRMKASMRILYLLARTSKDRTARKMKVNSGKGDLRRTNAILRKIMFHNHNLYLEFLLQGKRIRKSERRVVHQIRVKGSRRMVDGL